MTETGLPAFLEENLILPSVLLVSLVAVLAILAVSVRPARLSRILLYLVSFAAGGLLGDAFLHLLPEAVEQAGGFTLALSLYVLLGIVSAFVVEKFLHWHHHSTEHHHDEDRLPPLAFMNLFGDFLHNFLDGIIIAASYFVSVPVGIATTLAVIAHEIPQEIGDFGVLLHAGLSKTKALLFNLASALAAVVGAVLVMLVGGLNEGLLAALVPFAVGNFIYIAGSDLIPELHKVKEAGRGALQVLFLLLGIGAMALLLFLE